MPNLPELVLADGRIDWEALFQIYEFDQYREYANELTRNEADFIETALGLSEGAALLAGGWAADVDAVTSGIVSNQYRAGELRIMEEVETLLDTGNSAGYRLLLRVHRNLAASVYAKPDSSTARWTYADKRLYDLYGQAAEDGYLPAGEWVHLGAAGDLGPWAALSPVFVERAEYRAGTGLTLEPEGNEDVYSTGAVQG
jgi:hypothetical protein